jgi:hypothetical protein
MKRRGGADLGGSLLSQSSSPENHIANFDCGGDTMSLREVYVLHASDSQALDALMARCAQAARNGNDAESRAYLWGIFEVLAGEQQEREIMRWSA